MRLVHYYENKKIIDAQWKTLGSMCPKGKKLIRHHVFKFAVQVCKNCESPNHAAQECTSNDGLSHVEDETGPTMPSYGLNDAWARTRTEVLQMSRDSGPADGGTDVWIMGYGLDQITQVLFGSKTAQVKLCHGGGTLLIVTSPAAPEGHNGEALPVKVKHTSVTEGAHTSVTDAVGTFTYI